MQVYLPRVVLLYLYTVFSYSEIELAWCKRCEAETLEAFRLSLKFSCLDFVHPVQDKFLKESNVRCWFFAFS